MSPPVGRPVADQSSARPSTILFVEDVRAVRIATSRLLAIAGFNVITAESAAEGMDLFIANPGQIDLLITDLSMPGLNGLDFAKVVRATVGDLPVVITSALPADGDPAGGLGLNCVRLTKPFEFTVLLTAIQGLLGIRNADQGLRTA